MRRLVVGMAVAAGALAFAGRAEAKKASLLDRKLSVLADPGGDYGAAPARADASIRSVLRMDLYDEGGGAGSPPWWVLEFVGSGIAAAILGFLVDGPFSILAISYSSLFPLWVIAGALASGLIIIPPLVVLLVTWMAATFDGVNANFVTTLLYTYLAFAAVAAIQISVSFLGLWKIISTVAAVLACAMPVYAVNFMTAGGGAGVRPGDDARRDTLKPEDRHCLAPGADLLPSPIRPALAISF